MKKIAIFASGSGTNAENITLHFQQSPVARVVAIICNNPRAAVLQRAQRLHLPAILITRDDLLHPAPLLHQLRDLHVDLIVLAGFLWRLPAPLLQAYPRRVINIHPALLPRHGGKGMYGHHVHQAVLDARDTTSGITIHHVNEQYDSGDIIFQATCPVFSTDTPDTLAARVHALEYTHYPLVIEQLLTAPQP